MSKFATIASKLFELVANCSEQTANQNTKIVAEVSKVVRKRTSGLTAIITLISLQVLHARKLAIYERSLAWPLKHTYHSCYTLTQLQSCQMPIKIP